MSKKEQVQKETPIRNIFLRAFVREMMKNVLPEETPVHKSSIEVTLTKSEPQMNPSLATPEIKLNPPLMLPKRNIISQRIGKPAPQRNLVQRFFRPAPQQKPIIAPETKPMQLMPLPAQNNSNEFKEKFDFGKLSKFLSDPSVFSVEVPGPGKYILVNRAGRVEMSNIALTKQEIDNVINDISEKTKIPVLPGVFKTALADYLLTAVVSDFVGTRFVIQKRNQFNNPVSQNPIQPPPQNGNVNNHYSRSAWQG